MGEKMKKKIAYINLGNFGSTGKIIRGIGSLAIRNNYSYTLFYPGEKNNHTKQEYDILMCSEFSKKINQKLAYFSGFNGCFSVFTTYRLLHKLRKLDISLIHLHNLHNSYINLPMLFSYLSRKKIPVVWTLHDCWAFTGQCPHFTMVKCDKWITGCYNCPKYHEYPEACIDRTKMMWNLKRRWFTSVQNMTIVTPSQWLADHVKMSFLREYPVKVINNGIDLSVFKPSISSFREKYNLINKFIVLGVSYGWDKRKGLDVFIELSKRLDQSKYQIVLVGTNDNIDKQLCSNIISIHRTQNQQELAEIYSAADIFVNPTREDNFPTVNIEALACGTPVLTFRTGGSPEIIDETSGYAVDCDDFAAMEREIIRICTMKPYTVDACLKRAKCFDINDKYKEYIKLYEDITYSS